VSEKTPNPQSKKIATLIADLKSGNVKKISTALKTLEASGNVQILEPLAEVLMDQSSEDSHKEIVEFLSSMKDSSAIDEMMRILSEARFIGIRQALLTTIWNSPLDYSYYLPDFVDIAVEGNFLEALDCLTIIENMEGPFEERHVLESQLFLRDYIESKEPKDPQKQHIMSEIAIFIKDLHDRDDDGITSFMDED
jgi:hypothetical protein